MAVQWVDREILVEVGIGAVLPAKSVLDIGCGLRPQTIIRPHTHICCEPFAEYAQELTKRFSTAPGLFVVQNTALNFLDQLPDKAVDTIFMLDVIEHIDKEEGLRILAACERVARQQIVLFTPLGFMEQDYESGDEDAWGFSGGFWQKHRSGWVPEDFGEGWDVYACEDFHIVNGKGDPLDPPGGALWAIRTFHESGKALSKKTGIFSLSLPPSQDEEAQRVGELVEYVAPSTYTVLSTNNYDYYQDSVLAVNAVLPATYHHLQSPVSEDVNQSWLVRLAGNTSLKNALYKLSYFWTAQRQYTRQFTQIIKDEDIQTLLMTSVTTSALLAAHRASRKRGIKLIIYIDADLQWDKSRFMNWIRQFVYGRNELILIGQEGKNSLLQELRP